MVLLYKLNIHTQWSDFVWCTDKKINQDDSINKELSFGTIKTITTDYAIPINYTNLIYFMNTNSTNINITLPDSDETINGQSFHFKNTGSNVSTIITYNSELINGITGNHTLNENEILTLTSIGATGWSTNHSIVNNRPSNYIDSDDPVDNIIKNLENYSMNTINIGSFTKYHIYNKQNIGTNGGSSISGSWNTCVLNTIDGTDSNIILNSNQFTVPEGKWKINALIPCYKTGQFQSRLYNITDSTTINYGTSVKSNADSDMKSQIWSIFTINSPKLMRIEYFCEKNKPDDGLGIASGFGDEMFTMIMLEKI